MPGDEPRPVSGFGHLRVNAWLAAHRSLSQPSHVLHRLSTPRHPPGTLSNLTTFLSRTLARELFKSRSFVVTTFLKLSKIASARSGNSSDPEVCRGGTATGGSGTSPTTNRRRGAGPAARWRFIRLEHQALAWWRRQDSNLRPPACKAGALPLSYAPASREGRRRSHGGPMWTRTTDLTLIRRTL